MDLNKKNMKSWMLLIVFAVLVYGVVQRIEILAAGFAFLYSIIMPFVLGAAMAFILNIPMHFLEKRLFRKAKKRKFVRPVCLVLSIFFVVAVIQIACGASGSSHYLCQHQQKYRGFSSSCARMGHEYLP